MNEKAGASAAISVLLPLFNGAEFLHEQVQSILDQTGVDVRLIILDDASRDGSRHLARSLADADGRITVLESDENRGLIQTLDRLLSFVQTPYFALSDQDDVWDPDKLQTSIDFLTSRGHELVYSDVRIIDASGREQVSTYLGSRRIRPIEGREPVPFAYQNPAIGHTLVGLRRVAEAARPLPGRLVFHEAWLVAVACSLGTVGFVPVGPLGSYRVHASNVVGPSSGGFVAKARRVLSGTGRLVRRERIRSNAISAMAGLDPSLAGAASLYSTVGLARVLRLPLFVRFQLARNRQSGPKSILVETAAFGLGAFVGARRGGQKRA